MKQPLRFKLLEYLIIKFFALDKEEPVVKEETVYLDDLGREVRL